MKSQTVEELAADLAGLAARIQAAIPEALEACKPDVIEGIRSNFAREQSPDGIAWPARQKVGDGHPLLVETNTEGSGSLLDAATGGGGHVSRIEGDTLIIGVDKMGGIGGIPGAGVHNYGYDLKNIPQREFMGIDEPTKDDCADRIAEVIHKVLV